MSCKFLTKISFFYPDLGGQYAPEYPRKNLLIWQSGLKHNSALIFLILFLSRKKVITLIILIFDSNPINGICKQIIQSPEIQPIEKQKTSLST